MQSLFTDFSIRLRFDFVLLPLATEQVVEQDSVSKTGTIVIPSLKPRTAQEWFEFEFDDRVYGKTTTTAGVERLFGISSLF